MKFLTGLCTLTGALLVLVLPVAAGCSVRQVETVEVTRPEDAVPTENLAHLTMVKVFINGQGPYNFVVDTGAGVMVLNNDLVNTLKIPVVGTTEVGSPMGTEPMHVDSLQVGSVKIGDTVIEDLPAVALELQDMFGSLEAPDGILAAASFEGFLMTMDFPNKFVLLRKGELPPADGRRVLDYSATSVVPNIPVSIAGETVYVAMDTGAPSTVVLPGTYISTLPLESEPVVVGSGRTVDATFEILSSRLEGTLDIGDISIENPTIAFNDRMKHPHIGMGVLADYSVTIDRSNRRVMLEQPQQGSTSGSPTRHIVRRGGKKIYGIKMEGISGDVLYVNGVENGLPAAEAGLMSGDRIVAMNGQSLKSLNDDERMSFMRGSPLVLRIERGADTIELTMTLD